MCLSRLIYRPLEFEELEFALITYHSSVNAMVSCVEQIARTFVQ